MTTEPFNGPDVEWVTRFMPLAQDIFASWLQSGEWPKPEDLQRRLDRAGHDIEVAMAIKALPRVPGEQRPVFPSAVALPIRILPLLPETGPLLAAGVQIVRRAIDVYLSGEPLEVKSDDPELLSATGGETALLRRAYRLFSNDYPNPFGGGGHSETTWQLAVSGSSARRFRGVKTLDDYIARQAEILAEGHQPPAPVESRPYSAFVLMPFNEQWSPGVYDMIRRAADSLRDELDIRCERADEFTRPGKITDQIVQAIETADILIAEITGANPNVMWELGYAQALGKPVVILNQAVVDSPFDLRDWRQVIYSASPTDADTRNIALYIRGAVEAPD